MCMCAQSTLLFDIRIQYGVCVHIMCMCAHIMCMSWWWRWWSRSIAYYVYVCMLTCVVTPVCVIWVIIIWHILVCIHHCTIVFPVPRHDHHYHQHSTQHDHHYNHYHSWPCRFKAILVQNSPLSLQVLVIPIDQCPKIREFFLDCNLTRDACRQQRPHAHARCRPDTIGAPDLGM